MDEREHDAQTLRGLVDRYREAAEAAGVDVESVTIGEALHFLDTGEL